MDKKFWESYYSSNKSVDFPSPFAEYCVRQNYIRDSVIVDIGCGNGRDSFYFVNNYAKEVLGIDQSEIVTEKNTKNITNLTGSLQNKIKFISADFVKPESYIGLNSNFYYSRFTFHAITIDEQSQFIEMLSEIMLSDDICAIEARTISDKTFQKGVKTSKNTNFTDHHRCFSNPNDIVLTIINQNFDLLYFEESDKFAIYNEDKPSVMRVIFRKK